ncbi:MAG TPA: hypothetical protein VK171_07530 [Fimbriimonas sp.]|nr:hypothetical protein [Fimbriimonas sp.]
MKFTLRRYFQCERKLVYGNAYSRLLVGQIGRYSKPPEWAKGRKVYAWTSWNGAGYEWFDTVTAAQNWLEQQFREQILGERS